MIWRMIYPPTTTNKGIDVVMARLHIICGNCGCNDDFEYMHSNSPADRDELTMRYKTTLVCKNCSTRHDLDDNAENKNKTAVKLKV